MKKLLTTAFRLGKSGNSSELSSLVRMFPHLAEDLKVEYRLGYNARTLQPTPLRSLDYKRTQLSSQTNKHLSHL